MNNETTAVTNFELPFQSYPGEGRKLLPRVKGDSCRHGYGLNHQRLTGQSCCAYCGRDFTVDYGNWLMMALDHVIPANLCEATGIPREWSDSHSNRVLLCSACNGFKNRWAPEDALVCPTTEAEFFDMRDAMFIERRQAVIKRDVEERAFFDSKPWETIPCKHNGIAGKKLS
jgi:5-methylcytosine-specific restriction endonuclease McrA